MLPWQGIEVEILDQDTYGRPVVFILQGDLNVSEKIIREGFAWVYRHYCKESFCSDWLMLENRAREEKLGLWLQEHPVEPWVFRHRK